MTASRWNANLLEIIHWIGNNDLDVSAEELLMPSIFPRLSTKKDEPDVESEEKVKLPEEILKYPDTLPILPLRGVVVYPQTAVPLTIGQPRSIRLIDDIAGGAHGLAHRLQQQRKPAAQTIERVIPAIEHGTAQADQQPDHSVSVPDGAGHDLDQLRQHAAHARPRGQVRP